MAMATASAQRLSLSSSASTRSHHHGIHLFILNAGWALEIDRRLTGDGNDRRMTRHVSLRVQEIKAREDTLQSQLITMQLNPREPMLTHGFGSRREVDLDA
ncbi:hypothetical protein BV22DRAFT_1035011 [Leucogyrophana mollusca]|uniref:Uncharacterized protein n=1 Tax=Leucogyrophana mollusca TaxID=85980 RepID=A0ACB8BG11_9AGAM|nr:hypothetical protein BV22DRAFT_1035011 [Leucogyrophana mollusca]